MVVSSCQFHWLFYAGRTLPNTFALCIGKNEKIGVEYFVMQVCMIIEFIQVTNFNFYVCCIYSERSLFVLDAGIAGSYEAGRGAETDADVGLPCDQYYSLSV